MMTLRVAANFNVLAGANSLLLRNATPLPRYIRRRFARRNLHIYCNARRTVAHQSIHEHQEAETSPEHHPPGRRDSAHSRLTKCGVTRRHLRQPIPSRSCHHRVYGNAKSACIGSFHGCCSSRKSLPEVSLFHVRRKALTRRDKRSRRRRPAQAVRRV
jgi:hypothetical protein